MPNGTRDARLTEWMWEYGGAIYRLCYAYLADFAQAEDATQDTFLKAWRNMEQFEGRNQSSEKTWLTRIAVNVCHDYHRSRWYRHVDMSRALEELASEGGMAVGEDRALLQDIAALPEKYRQVILLYYYQNMNQYEISRALGIGRSTVSCRLKRARKVLKRDLEVMDE